MVKHVLSSVSLYNMSVYAWPRLVLKDGDRLLRNFLWTWDPSMKKLVCVSWNKTTKPLEEGGLGLRSLREFNTSLIMKLAFNFLAKVDELSIFLASKYLNKDGAYIKAHRPSSIWKGIRAAITDI